MQVLIRGQMLALTFILGVALIYQFAILSCQIFFPNIKVRLFNIQNKEKTNS